MSNILKSLKTFKKKYPEELRVGLLATVVAFFFTHGLPLWNEDYSQWLAQANGSFFDLVLRIVLPITWSPETWGYSDRPVQALIYKIFHLVFGYWGTGFYLMKSIAFGAIIYVGRMVRSSEKSDCSPSAAVKFGMPLRRHP